MSKWLHGHWATESVKQSPGAIRNRVTRLAISAAEMALLSVMIQVIKSYCIRLIRGTVNSSHVITDRLSLYFQPLGSALKVLLSRLTQWWLSIRHLEHHFEHHLEHSFEPLGSWLTADYNQQLLCKSGFLERIASLFWNWTTKLPYSLYGYLHWKACTVNFALASVRDP